MRGAVLDFRPIPVLRPRLDGRAVAIVSLCVAALLVLAGGCAAGLRWHGRLAAPPFAIPVAPARPDWIEMPRPARTFRLEAPLLRDLASSYSARERSDGEREDLLVFGAPGLDAPSLRLRIHRRAGGAPAMTPPPLFAAVAREAAGAGLAVQRIGLADLMPSRFGAFEIVDLTLVDGETTRLPCTGLRLALDAPAITFDGLACGALGQPLERAALACLVDGLDLVAGGKERAIGELFARSEQRRQPGCAGAGPAPDAQQASRGDDKPATRAKTSHRH